jgi:hypothetical protein
MRNQDQVHQYAQFLLAMQQTFGSGTLLSSRKSRLRKALERVGIIGDKPWRRILGEEARKLRVRDGFVLEFGVYNGGSANFLARSLPRSTIVGFDSFSGFPDDGRPDWDQDLSVPTLPKVRKNVQLEIGFFEDTLPQFIARHGKTLRENVALIHIDCDIYSSTVTVFHELREILKPGTVIVFDEIVNYPEFAFNEALALFEFLEDSGLDARWSTNIGTMWLVSEAGTNPQFGSWKEFRRHDFFQNQSIVLCNRGEGGLIDTATTLDPSPALIAHVVCGLKERSALA